MTVATIGREHYDAVLSDLNGARTATASLQR
jgi:hypothetical protein